jgi:hypothetical protein
MCELEHHLFMLLRVEGIKAEISVNAVLHVELHSIGYTSTYSCTGS